MLMLQGKSGGVAGLETSADCTKKSENLSILASYPPSGARTLDPNIKSVVLYQLS